MVDEAEISAIMRRSHSMREFAGALEMLASEVKAQRHSIEELESRIAGLEERLKERRK